MTQKKTKIVATISDMRCDVDFIRALYNEGINVVTVSYTHLDVYKRQDRLSIKRNP